MASLRRIEMYGEGLWVRFFLRFYVREEYLFNNTTGTVYYQLKIGMYITLVVLLRATYALFL